MEKKLRGIAFWRWELNTLLANEDEAHVFTAV
jgi:hypothetical protein